MLTNIIEQPSKPYVLLSRTLSVLILALLVYECSAQENSEFTFSSTKIILQDVVDHFETGLNAGGEWQGAGEDFGDFSLSSEVANQGNFSAVLKTKEGGFTGPNDEFNPNNDIRVGKSFSPSIILDGQGKLVQQASTIDASEFTHLAYWLYSPNADPVRRVIVQLELNNDATLIWSQNQKIKSLAEVHNTEGIFTRVLLQLDQDFFRPSGTSTSDLANISKIRFLLQRIDGGGTDETKIVYIDDVIFLSPFHSLKIDSSPIDNVNITGSCESLDANFNISTPFQRPGLDDNDTCTATALETIEINGDNYVFDRWEFNGDDQGQDTTIDFQMFQKSTLKAIYQAVRHTITVESTPITGVPITGSTEGTTNFSSEFDDNTQVSFEAPLQFTLPQNNLDYEFVQWEKDSLVQQSNPITFNINDSTKLEAIYRIQTNTLTVKAETEQSESLNIPITGPRPGTTEYSVDIDDGNRVTLRAPRFQVINNENFNFLRWMMNDTKFERQTVIIPTIFEDTEVVAIYERGDFVLSITSLPEVGAEIDITMNGSMDAIVTHRAISTDSGAQVSLTANSTLEVAGKELDFARWVVVPDNEVVFSNSGSTIDFTMDADRTAIAIYNPVLTLVEGWNLISTPIVPSQSVTDAFFAATDVPVWTWDGMQFQVKTDTLDVGNGYWIFIENEQRLEISTTNSTGNQEKIPLQKGWELFGVRGNFVIHDPENSEFIDIITPNGKQRGKFWTWDAVKQQYIPIDSESFPLFQQDTLFPGQAYWIFITD